MLIDMVGRKILLVVAIYPEKIQKIFNEFISPRNKEYALKHNYEYIEITDKKQIKKKIQQRRENPSWTNFLLYDDWIDNGEINNGDIIVTLDADMYMVNMDHDFATNKSFTYSIDSGNTHCMGWHSIKINEWSKQLVKNIVSDERYEKFKHLTNHDGLSFWGIWSEQASWYSLAGITMHSDIPYFQIKDFGWNSDSQQDPQYTPRELYEHVEIKHTKYNVTEWPGESNCDYNINKLSNPKDVILRHFVSGQLWNDQMIDSGNYINLINRWKHV
tara:strand:+ start:2447 stop:3265 length:819 start_codon:yes stop_codon:yes gene_type:complete